MNRRPSFMLSPSMPSFALAKKNDGGVHEEVVEGIFGPTEEKLFGIRGRFGFQVKYIELELCEKDAFVLASFGIDGREHFILPDPISLDVFRNQAPLMLPKVTSGLAHNITIEIRNVTRKTQGLRFKLVGEIA